MVSVPRSDNDFACTGHARIIVESLAAEQIAAKILFLYDWWNKNEKISSGHAYVIPDYFRDEDLPLNMSNGSNDLEDGSDVTCGYLRQFGEDITDEILTTPWEMLG